jgi:hypothetical protein
MALRKYRTRRIQVSSQHDCHVSQTATCINGLGALHQTRRDNWRLDAEVQSNPIQTMVGTYKRTLKITHKYRICLTPAVCAIRLHRHAALTLQADAIPHWVPQAHQL